MQHNNKKIEKVKYFQIDSDNLKIRPNNHKLIKNKYKDKLDMLEEHDLTIWEYNFIQSIINRAFLTEKQLVCFNKIINKYSWDY